MRAVAAALLFLFAVLGEAASDVYLRVLGNDGRGGATASSWDLYMSTALVVALGGFIYEIYLHKVEVMTLKQAVKDGKIEASDPEWVTDK